MPTYPLELKTLNSGWRCPSIHYSLGDPRNVTSMYILVSHLEKAFGVHYVKGGVQALADAMANVVKEQGAGIIKFKCCEDKR